jgi:hypothetical protein
MKSREWNRKGDGVGGKLRKWGSSEFLDLPFSVAHKVSDGGIVNPLGAIPVFQ